MLSTKESVNAALRYLCERGAAGRPVSLLFSDARHAEALRRQAADRSLRWQHYRETGRVQLLDRLRTWVRSTFR
jgi:hypothetical protein